MTKGCDYFPLKAPLKTVGTEKVHQLAFFLKSPGGEGAGLSKASVRNTNLGKELTEIRAYGLNGKRPLRCIFKYWAMLC